MISKQPLRKQVSILRSESPKEDQVEKTEAQSPQLLQDSVPLTPRRNEFTIEDVTLEVIPDATPPLSAATLAEMEAGRAALKAIADEKVRLQMVIAKKVMEERYNALSELAKK